MKKRNSFKLLAPALLALLLLAGCGGDRETVNVYNWGDYIDETVLSDFEEETGIRVNYETYATNEDMYIKLKQSDSAYDVAFPSDYMIEKMIAEDLLLPIDTAALENYGSIDDNFKHLSFDPDNAYSVPYMWGTVGILYNTSMVEGEIASWDALWDPAYEGEILMLDSIRDSIAVALKKTGHSMNATDEAALSEAKAALIEQKPLVLAYVGDEVKDMMVAGEAALAVVWSGDAIVMMDENEDLAYVVPEEGTNLWFDNMVVPANAQNPEAALKFIDFMSRPDIALRNTEYIGYATTNKDAKALLDPEVRGNKAAYPDGSVIQSSEVFVDLGEAIRLYDVIWTEVKAY